MSKVRFFVIAIIAIAVNTMAVENKTTLGEGTGHRQVLDTYRIGDSGPSFWINVISFGSDGISATGVIGFYDPQEIEILGMSYSDKQESFLITYKVKSSGTVYSRFLDVNDESFVKFARERIKKSYRKENGNTDGFDDHKLTIKIDEITIATIS